MFCPDLGKTINYQPYVSSRSWHNNQLSTVCFVQTLVQQSTLCFVQTLAQQSTVCFVQDIGTTINYQPYILSKTMAQQSTINRMFRPRPWHNYQLSTVSFVQNLGTTINYQPYVSSRPWHNNQLSTVCFVQDIGTAINYQTYILSSKTLAEQSTINCMVCPDMAQQLSINRMFRQTLAQQSTINCMFCPDLDITINYQPYVSSISWLNYQP